MASTITTLIQQTKQIIFRHFFTNLLILINLSLRSFPILTPSRFSIRSALDNDFPFFLTEDKLWPLDELLII